MSVPRPEPLASRPNVAGYFDPAHRPPGLLPWSHVVEEMRSAHNYWIATCSEGRPHAMPVWGIWIDDRLRFSTSPASRKARNLAANPYAVAHLESGDRVVAIEGRTLEVADVAALRSFMETYNAKYDWNFELDQLQGGGVYDLVPLKAFAWLDGKGEGFSATGTRWIFQE